MQINGHDYFIGNYLHYMLSLIYIIKLFSSWISHLLNKSHKQKTLNINDLYDLLPQYESVKLTDKLEENWFDEIKLYPDKPSLFRATIRTMGWKPFLIGLLFIPCSKYD